MSSRAGTDGRQGYATAMAGLWGGLSGTLARLEKLAAKPGSRLADEESRELLPRLQYALHTASELALGIDPPAGAEAAHAELAAALRSARDATADVLEALEAGGPAAAGPLVYEWRGVLFRVRLARMRLAARPVAAPPEPGAELEPARTKTRAALVAILLVLGGAFAVALGATLALWPVWTLGFVLVAAGILAFQP